LFFVVSCLRGPSTLPVIWMPLKAVSPRPCMKAVLRVRQQKESVVFFVFFVFFVAHERRWLSQCS
jgi:hypothetical protein